MGTSRVRLAAVLAVSLLSLSATAGASLIRSRPFELFVGFGGDQTQNPLTTGFAVRLPGSTPAIFTELSLRPSDTGRTFSATPASDPDFVALAAALTDGVNQTLELRLHTLSVTSNSSIGVTDLPTESVFLWTSSTSPIDLAGPAAGQSINRIDMRLGLVRQSFSNGITFMALNGSLDFYVPAPGASLALLGAGGLGLVRRRRAIA